MVTSPAPTVERTTTSGDRFEPLWPRLARAHVEGALRETRAPRSVVIGPAGSGKSATLRYLSDHLEGLGRTAVVCRTAGQIAAAPPDDVVLVDDAHLLDDDALQAILDRVADPDAGTIVACRPWPLPAGLGTLLQHMDTPGTSVVLGQVTAAEVSEHVLDTAIDPACVEDLVQLCGGTAWLVSEAIAVHDRFECASGPAHDALVLALHEVIAQRLQHVPADVLMAVEVETLAPDSAVTAMDRGSDCVAAAHAQGLLLRNGRAVPIVRTAVRAATPVDRIVALTESGLVQPSAELLGGVRSAGIADALLQLGDVAADPQRSLELYDHAMASGAAAVDVAVRRSRALWAAGQLDEAAAAVDALHPAPGEAGAYVANILGSAWLARGMAETAASVYRTSAADHPSVRAGGLIAALAAGDLDAAAVESGAASVGTIPTAAAVAVETLERGLRASLTPAAQGALGELMRASDIYTMADASQPLPELPAALAAIVALNLGEVDVAAGILDAAIRDRQGGAAARSHLILWRGWVALQQQRPTDVESALAAASESPISPRDRLLDHALRIGLARRYSDTAGITAAWRRAREAMLHASFDLFSVLPLAEFVMTAARVEDPDATQHHFEQALHRVEQLGTPVVWSAPLHWAGVQQGILLGRPELLRPHARVLVDAASTSPVAAAMAHAGRVWTTVLGGTVDEDAVESAADQLANVGYAWDGSRLAGYGAGLSENRRTISRLLACARRLHSNDVAPPAIGEPVPAVDPARSGGSGTSLLSAREREVAALVLRGKTYAEIGTTIFISPRTAEHHIARIRQRLGATSRSELLTKLHLLIENGDDGDE